MEHAYVSAMLVGFLLIMNSAQMATAATCVDAGVNIQPCVGALTGATTASSDCCSGLVYIQKMEAELGIAPTCNCTKLAMIRIPGLVVEYSYSVDVQHNCTRVLLTMDVK
ncbi:non-specific lipid-transfer protein-like [Magnolia sinica]|uniref:non-specific lipid-transfer protein-like n=1 Tax=Magnolia sinica TaxID=86752 RepID=UPI002659D352|nr:non-specific lipid-transfer protein-like [Magnolia sinica]